MIVEQTFSWNIGCRDGETNIWTLTATVSQPQIECVLITWWRHQLETFSALLAICAGISPVTTEFRSQRSVTRSFDGFFYLCLNKRLSRESWGWWYETPSESLWRHCDSYTDTSKNSLATGKSGRFLNAYQRGHRGHFIWNLPQVNVRKSHWWYVNIGSRYVAIFYYAIIHTVQQ